MPGTGEIIICPSCKHTIKLDDQREDGELTKKGGHQMYTTTLAWQALLSLKGAGDMEDLIRGLINDHYELLRLQNTMGGVGTGLMQHQQQMAMVGPVVLPPIEKPVPTRGGNKTGNVRVNTHGYDSNKTIDSNSSSSAKKA